MALLYRVNNGPSAGASPPPKVTTGTATKTMLQLVAPNQPFTVIEWGISFDGDAAATPIQCELITTGTVAATVTAFSSTNDITTYNEQADPNVSGAGLTNSTTGSGYTATAEGSVVAPVRSGDLQLVAPSNQYVKQFPLGQGFRVPATQIMRIRVTAATAVNCYCYVIFGIGGD